MSASILLVSELFPPAIGGSGALLANVYGRLDGIPVTVLSDPGTSGGASGSHGGPFLRKWTRINGALRGIRSIQELRQIWRITRAIQRERGPAPDLVVHTARPLPEGLPAFVAKRLAGARLRYVCWVHGEELNAALSSREHGWLSRTVCHGASIMIANSGFSADLIASIGVPRERIRIVRPGVDINRFRPDIDGASERTALAPSGPMVLSVGRLQKRKGHDLAIKAVALLRPRYPGLRYVVAGDGRERSALERLAEDQGVRDNVVFLGEIDDARLPALYTAADVFAMPTRTDGADVEGFGIVYLEAAASGRPSIGGRNGGVPEAVSDGETGILVSGTDARELAAAFDRLLGSESIRLAMGTAGRHRVTQLFTWERAARAVEAIHRELTDSRSGS